MDLESRTDKYPLLSIACATDEAKLWLTAPKWALFLRPSPVYQDLSAHRVGVYLKPSNGLQYLKTGSVVNGAVTGTPRGVTGT